MKIDSGSSITNDFKIYYRGIKLNTVLSIEFDDEVFDNLAKGVIEE